VLIFASPASGRALGKPAVAIAVTTIRVYENPAVIQDLTVRPRQLTLAADGNDTITG
jgi:hypothetical protein